MGESFKDSKKLAITPIIAIKPGHSGLKLAFSLALYPFDRECSTWNIGNNRNFTAVCSF
jgi:hypothetical protein